LLGARAELPCRPGYRALSGCQSRFCAQNDGSTTSDVSPSTSSQAKQRGRVSGVLHDLYLCIGQRFRHRRYGVVIGPGTPHTEPGNEAIAIAEAESSAEELAEANPGT